MTDTERFDTGADELLRKHRKIESDWYAEWRRQMAARWAEVQRERLNQQLASGGEK